jgi:probable Rubsico expression protein CbbX
MRVLSVAADRPGAYRTIGSALLEAPDGAAIAIAAGTYAETLELTGRSVTLQAEDGADVVLDGSGADWPTIRAVDGSLTLRGLQLRATDGIALSVDRTALTVEDCTVTGRSRPAISVHASPSFGIERCTVSGAETGIVVEGAGGQILNTTVRDVAGDGIVVALGADPLIRGCTISGCGGRGVYVYQYSRPELVDVEVGQAGAEGIGVAHGSTPLIRRPTVHDTRGPAITFAPGCSGTVEGLHASNTAEPALSIAAGCAVEVVEESTATAENGPVDELLGELDAMVGLPGVKAEVRALVDEIQVNEWRRSAGLSVGAVSHHLIFAGAPGTGKTTVARLYGKLLKALGVLPDGGFVEVSRRDLVGQYIGHTAEKTAQVFEKALGGVLFIDEAYYLHRPDNERDYGQEAIEVLLSVMESERHNLVVIMAGYQEPMNEFFLANPGMGSRVAHHIHFPDYKPDELMEIAAMMVRGQGFEFSEEAEKAMRDYVERRVDQPRFANGRSIRNAVERARMRQAMRLFEADRPLERQELMTIEAEDIRQSSVFEDDKIPAYDADAEPEAAETEADEQQSAA